MDIVKPMRNQGFLLFGKAEIIIDMKVKKRHCKNSAFFLSVIITIRTNDAGIVDDGISAAGRTVGFCTFTFASDLGMHFFIVEHCFHNDIPFLFVY